MPLQFARVPAQVIVHAPEVHAAVLTDPLLVIVQLVGQVPQWST